MLRRSRARRARRAWSRRTRPSARPACRPRERSRAVAPTTGRFLFSLVAPQTDCEVLEIGGSRGYSTVWLAAGVRHLGGRVLSVEHDPRKVEAWRRNIADAGLEDCGRADRGRRQGGRARDRRRLRRRLPRRREGGLRGAVPARARRSSSPARWSSPTTSSPTRRRSARTPARARPTRRSSPSPSRSTAASSCRVVLRAD